MAKTITSKIFVVRDNIDMDQIIPAQYLPLVPAIAEEYEKLGSYAPINLPNDQYPTPLVPEGKLKTEYRLALEVATSVVDRRANTLPLPGGRPR